MFIGPQHAVTRLYSVVAPTKLAGRPRTRRFLGGE
jgi:hypothetical protein